jgi:hypothetical protein
MRRWLLHGMRTITQQRQADQAALDAYLRSRRDGQPQERALNAAVFRWVQHCGWVDGRLARARVAAILLRAQVAVPADYEGWLIAASGSDAWQQGALSAIRRLSVQCRSLLASADGSFRHAEPFETIGAEIVAEYVRTELPPKVSRLRHLARQLFTGPAAPEGTEASPT